MAKSRESDDLKDRHESGDYNWSFFEIRKGYVGYIRKLDLNT